MSNLVRCLSLLPQFLVQATTTSYLDYFFRFSAGCVLQVSCFSTHCPYCGHSDLSEMKTWSSHTLVKILEWFLEALLVKTSLFYNSNFTLLASATLAFFHSLNSFHFGVFCANCFFFLRDYFLCLSHPHPFLLSGLLLFIHRWGLDSAFGKSALTSWGLG